MPIWLWIIVAICLALYIAITILYFEVENLPVTVSHFTKKYKLVGIISEIVASLLFVLFLFVNTHNAIPFFKACLIFVASIVIIFAIFRAFVSIRAFTAIAGLCVISIIVSFFTDYFVLMSIGVGALFAVICGIFITAVIVQRHALFINYAKSIQQDMLFEELKTMFSTMPATNEQDGETLIITYEKTQWRGFLRGGTIVRSVKVTLVGEKVVKVATKNMDVPVW